MTARRASDLARLTRRRQQNGRKSGEWTMIFASSSTIIRTRNRLIIVNQCFGGNDF